MRVDVRGMLRTTFRHRCPACGDGLLFRGSYALRERCSACGLNLKGEHGAHYGGPIILGYAISGFAGLAAFGLLYWRFGYAPWVTWSSVAAAALALLLTFRHIKAHWTWWLYSVGELKGEDGRRSAEHQPR